MCLCPPLQMWLEVPLEEVAAAMAAVAGAVAGLQPLCKLMREPGAQLTPGRAAAEDHVRMVVCSVHGRLSDLTWRRLISPVAAEQSVLQDLAATGGGRFFIPLVHSYLEALLRTLAWSSDPSGVGHAEGMQLGSLLNALGWAVNVATAVVSVRFWEGLDPGHHLEADMRRWGGCLPPAPCWHGIAVSASGVPALHMSASTHPTCPSTGVCLQR